MSDAVHTFFWHQGVDIPLTIDREAEDGLWYLYTGPVAETEAELDERAPYAEDLWWKIKELLGMEFLSWKSQRKAKEDVTRALREIPWDRGRKRWGFKRPKIVWQEG
jgi:hypothetical protein